MTGSVNAPDAPFPRPCSACGPRSRAVGHGNDTYVSKLIWPGLRGALYFYRSKDRERDCSMMYGSLMPMQSTLPNFRDAVCLHDCGRWVQEERPSDVNAAIVGLLQQEFGPGA